MDIEFKTYELKYSKLMLSCLIIIRLQYRKNQTLDIHKEYQGF